MKKIRTTNHKITAALLVAVMMLSVIFTAVFSGDVKAKAENKEYSLSYTTGKAISSEDNFFTITGTIASTSPDNVLVYNGESFTTGGKFKSGCAISFSASEAGVVTVVCLDVNKGKSRIKITDGNSNSVTYAPSQSGSRFSQAISKGTCKIERAASECALYLITYTPGQTEPTNSYNITVSDNGKSTTGIYTEGATLTLSATGDNFAYWKNSKDVIVGRDKIVNMPVYYGETYTAVYNTEHKVNYLTAYEQVLYSYSKSEFTSTSVPEGPVRYGYAFTGWDTSYDDIVKALDNNDVYVRPIYESADGEEYNYEITVNTEKFGGSSVTKSYRVNEVVTATVSSDNFAYWKDETDKIVSYSPTYLFFANKATTVTAVAGSAGKEDDAKAVITTVSSKKASDDSNVVIFEYNIPAGYHIDFAGVVASKTVKGDSLVAEKDGVYVIGDNDLSYTTYRYTLTSKAGVTWNVKPMLKYTYNGKTHTIYGEPITLN